MQGEPPGFSRGEDVSPGVLGPRVTVAGTHSGVGKTTVATGVMAAFARRGERVASAKVGPDFIDPGYHRLATSRPGRNLDAFLCGDDAIVPLANRASKGASITIVEGVMGLFDGVGASSEASTAEVALAIRSPVILVVDASSLAGSVAALVDGYDSFLRKTSQRFSTRSVSSSPRYSRSDPANGLAGVVLNRVGSDNHESILRRALEPLGIPVLGALRRDDTIEWRDRHLGLVPVVEDPVAIQRSLQRLAGLIENYLDLDAIERVANCATDVPSRDLPSIEPVTATPCPIAVIGGPAFSFNYPDNLERLKEAGAELVDVDPLVDTELPERVRGLYACGGYPEVFAKALAENRSLLQDVQMKLNRGMPAWAECGGLLWLAESLDDANLCGVIPARGEMTRRITVGYRTARVLRDNPVVPRGTTIRAHELHYSKLDPPGDALAIEGFSSNDRGGWATPTLFASYLHLHLGWDAAPALRFVRAASALS